MSESKRGEPRDDAPSPPLQVSSREEEILQEPYNYITQIPGKDIRSQLIQAFNLWLKVPDDKLSKIKSVTKILHNASLLIDDIEDNSKLRRGIPVAHSVYGVAQTINCANYMYFKAMAEIAALGHPDAAQVFTDQLLELHRGQGMDIYWRDAFVCPTEDEYRTMVLRKTGGLFQLAVQIMQLFSDDSRDYTPLLNAFGLYFQIRDDYANLQSKEYEDNKSFCEDITEGKFSFPIIHSIRATPHDRQLLNILKQRTTDVDLKRHCLDCMKRTGSFDYTMKELNRLEVQARDLIAKLGGNPILSAIMDKLTKLHHPAEDASAEATPAPSTS
ncbi:quemao protein [Salpingoeca rosetta]|uniref:Quemao protein n=1 Tax=Salpingoeca rosetta (strain ATCC 50818 / BSB-021) TaxID=946362 RepID=F2U151_SALR5|nr:quemao protein [Salpingoeca rosetta]EGD80625.1 quemao protein [Salpingoeca rosetta]|eukprot:XP_004997186.1 quemao protein [Salpingoeca rosetta]